MEFDDFFGASTRLKGVTVAGAFLEPGVRVRLRPRAKADIMDLVLSGQTAIIEAVEEDAERRIHLALVLEDDPGKDLGLARQPGHRFFFGVDEVEPLREEAP
jgi:hydrogenase maturation protease